MCNYLEGINVLSRDVSDGPAAAVEIDMHPFAVADIMRHGKFSHRSPSVTAEFFRT